MVVLPSGKFRMGDIQGKYGKNEQPVHEVHIARRFAISKYEITFDQYDEFASATGLKFPDDEGWGRGSQPVIHVSWNDAVAYAAWLSRQTDRRYCPARPNGNTPRAEEPRRSTGGVTR